MMKDTELFKNVIVTTKVKKQAVRRLYEFWTMKGLFLQSKLDPRLVENKEYQQKTVDFLDRHSDLVDQKFWNNLNPTEKLKASRFLIFQEIEGDRNLRVSSKKDQAELFVVMHGNVIVKSQDTLEEVEYKQGEVFGAVDLFNVASENINDEHDVPKELDESRTMTVSTRNRGCYVRLSFSDYYKYVANNEVEEDLEAERKEFSKIAEIDYQLLTEEDKLCVESYKIAKKVLNKNLFLFMDAYKMIPRNARGPSSKYLMHGNLGREVVLKGSDARSIIVVLDGSVRLEIVAKRKISREHTIAYKRRGVKPMVINKESMPLLLLDPGAMLSLEEECFRVGSVPVEAIDSIGDSFGCPVIGNINARPISPSASSAEGTSVSHSIAGAHTKDKELNGKKYGKGILKRRGSSGAVEIAQSEVKLSAETLSIHDAASLTSVQTMYHLKLIFEKPSKYLQVPYDLFVNHISDTIAQFGKGIRIQLDLASTSVLRRIDNLLPWINGSMEFYPIDFTADESLKPNHFVVEPLQHTGVENITQGSFGALQATKPNSKPASPQLSNRRSANRKKSVAYSPKRRSKFDNSNAFAAFDSLLNEVVHEEVDESEIDEKKAIEAATIAAAKVMGKDFVSNSADVREKQWGGVVSRPLVKAEITKGKKSDSSRSDETFEDYKLTRPLQKQFSTIHE